MAARVLVDDPDLPLFDELFDAGGVEGGVSTDGPQYVLVLSPGVENDHPKANMIDGKEDTFWITAHMMPREFTVCFRFKQLVSAIRLNSTMIQNIQIDATPEAHVCRGFSQVLKREGIPKENGQMQETMFKFDNPIALHCLRFNIKKCYDFFASIHHVEVIRVPA